MGLFGKKSKKKETRETSGQWMTVDEALKKSTRDSAEKDVDEILDRLQEQLKNADRIHNETIHEYNEIEKHLSDIRIFETLPKELRTKVIDLAGSIDGFEKQRQRYLEGNKIISDEKYKKMEMYAEEIPEKLKTMEEQERYLMLVKNDMRQLEGEKGSVTYEKDEAVKKKKFLIKFSCFCIALMIVISIVLFVVGNSTGKSMLLPFMVMATIACIYTAYFVVTVKNCDDTVRKNEKLTGRAVDLLNSVKIKYVNTVNALDYTYEKYGCNSHQELAYIWQGYKREKEEEKKYKKNTDLLTASQDSLSDMLSEVGFKLPNMWPHQAELLIDNGALREFEEVLTDRHRKLKAQLDFNQKQKDGMLSDIKTFKKKYPEYAGLLKNI